MGLTNMFSERLRTNLTCLNIQDKITLTNHRHTSEDFTPLAMIISASRRTDISAFYSEWFINRIRAGYCTIPNPFNSNQVSTVSLRPEDVDVIVFWTRNPRPMFPYLLELDESGYRYYFQYTILNYPRVIDPKSPSLETAIKSLCELSNQIGPERIIWRYDPIVFSEKTDAQFHLRSYRYIADAIKGRTERSVISIMDEYSKAKKRLFKMGEQGAALIRGVYNNQPWFDDLMHSLVDIANNNHMEIVSCAEEIDLQPYGIKPGKCVDDDLIERIFGINVLFKKDPSQREECGCVVSKDIGIYDTCLFGCQYCYATKSFALAKNRYQEHDPTSPSLIKLKDTEPYSPNLDKKPKQLNLF